MRKLVSIWQVVKARGFAALSHTGQLIRTRLPGFKAAGYSLVPVEDFPDALKPNKVYMAGEANNYWGAAMLCPCGCGETIQLNLLKDVRPCWSVKKNSKGAVTIVPSVWRQKGCKSHFFVRAGKIVWA
jgi:hypothetical protein